MTALLAIVIKYLPYLVTAAAEIPQITTFLAEIQSIFKRTKVWTPEQEQEFDAATEALRSDPAWQVID